VTLTEVLPTTIRGRKRGKGVRGRALFYYWVVILGRVKGMSTKRIGSPYKVAMRYGEEAPYSEAWQKLCAGYLP
jgi:hypothetical protein